MISAGMVPGFPSSLLPLSLRQLHGLQRIKTDGSARRSHVDEAQVTDTCQIPRLGNLHGVADFWMQIFGKRIIIIRASLKVTYVHSQSGIWNFDREARPDLESSVFFHTITCSNRENADALFSVLSQHILS